MHILLPTLLGLIAASAATQSLQQAADSFAGAPVSIDPRLATRPCAQGYRLQWSASAAAVIARCGHSGPALVIPLAAGRAGAHVPEPAPALRRGDRVSAELTGDGFQIRLDAIAEQVDRNGRVMLRNGRGGRSVAAMLDRDGQLRIGQ